MQELKSHKIAGLNAVLQITVMDKPGPGNACHEYAISKAGEELGTVKFQKGPIAENGVNGVSNEALLAIVEHRLDGFQAGDFRCRENAIALTKLQEAMMWLQKRTRDRIDRGVEGTSQK